MLPGFRFLFAAIVLSFSTLVFGLGAAALLRASHDQFASLPAMPPAPALPRAATADASPPDAAPPTLALLRVDAPALDAAPRTVPAPVIEQHIAPTPEATETVIALPSPDLSVSEPKPAPAAASTANEPSGTIDETTADKVASPATPSSQLDTRQTAVETPAVQLETHRPEPIVMPTDITKAEPAQSQPASARHAQTGTAEQTAPAQPTPADVEVTKVEAAKPHIPEVAMTQEIRPAPLPPADAPIKTAMLTPIEPASSAIPDPAVAISGPIPLPRSREWALAQGHAVRQPVRKRTAAVRARPRAVVRQPVRPQTQAPSSAPNLLFPFGQ